MRHDNASRSGLGRRGSRPLARRTSSWWMKNSSPLTTLRIRGTPPGNGRRPGAQPGDQGGESLGFLCSALGVGPAVEVLAQDKVRGEIGRRPPLAQRGRIRTQLEQEVTELDALADVDRFGQRDGRGDCTCSAKNSSVHRHAPSAAAALCVLTARVVGGVAVVMRAAYAFAKARPLGAACSNSTRSIARARPAPVR